MTHTATERKQQRRNRSFPRLRRFAAVLGLCLVTMPVTGFWVDSNDAGRGINAVRMRLDLNALPQSASFTRLYAVSSGARQAAMPLSLDKARYRATLRDMPKPQRPEDAAVAENPRGTSLVSLVDNQVSLALADKIYLPLPRLSMEKPSQEYRFWAKSGTFIPADGQHRSADPSDTVWLVDADWKPGGECLAGAETSLSSDMRQLVFRMRQPFSLTSPHPKSSQYMEMISNASKRFGLPPQLIYGIMRTESAFNPFAVSNAGALGLMQLVPDTAGNEVHAYLTGKAGKPTRTLLFDPENNIEYGSAYLHLLATRYFAAVSNKAARQLCMIAGYNAGPRAVLKVFSNDTDQALAAINALSPEELFAALSRKMPAEETRQYIGRVLASINSFPR